MQNLQKEHQSNIDVVKQEYSKKEALAIQAVTQQLHKAQDVAKSQEAKHQSEVESLKREFGTNQAKLREEAQALRQRLQETKESMQNDGAKKLQEESQRLESEFKTKLSEKEQALQAALTAGAERSETISALKDDLRMTQDKATDLTKALDAAHLELQELKSKKKKEEEAAAAAKQPMPMTQQSQQQPQSQSIPPPAQEMTFSPPPSQGQAPMSGSPADASGAEQPNLAPHAPSPPSDKRASLINLDTPDKWDEIDDGQNPSPRPFFELN